MSEDFLEILFVRGSPLTLICVAPPLPTLHRRYYCYFFSTLLVYILDYIYITFIYNIVVYF